MDHLWQEMKGLVSSQTDSGIDFLFSVCVCVAATAHARSTYACSHHCKLHVTARVVGWQIYSTRQMKAIVVVSMNVHTNA